MHRLATGGADELTRSPRAAADGPDMLDAPGACHRARMVIVSAVMGLVTATVELDRRGWFVDAATKQMVLDGRFVAGGSAPAIPPGFRIDAQVALATVGERYLIALPLGRVDVALENSLATVGRIHEAMVVLVERSCNGYARARFLSHGDEVDAAMAVAVVRYSWAWDETKEIIVELGIGMHGVSVVPPRTTADDRAKSSTARFTAQASPR